MLTSPRPPNTLDVFVPIKSIHRADLTDLIPFRRRFLDHLLRWHKMRYLRRLQPQRLQVVLPLRLLYG